jgi:hypothetical protein
MNKRLAVAALLLFVFSTWAVADDMPPAPQFDRIKYDRPNDYLSLTPSLGDADHIRAAAAPLKRATPEKTLAAIHKWVNAELKCQPEAAYEYRDFDHACAAKLYGGCADYAVVFTALSRACGIPTVFVKTMDADWIREFRASGKCNSWRGHVFLEVFIDGKWKLLEPGWLTIYDDYDPKTRRLLPGDRWAYDKGADPKEIVLSPDWERWKIQTAAHFKDFDLAQLPPGVGDRGRNLAAKVYVAADSPVWQMINKHLGEAGHKVRSFNANWDAELAAAKGGDLVITCIGQRLVLPPERHDLLPIPYDEIQAKLTTGPGGVERKTADDGTRVVLLYTRDLPAMEKLISDLRIDSSQ